MRRDTAVRRVRLIAERCGQVGRVWPVLGSVHVFGELLDGVPELEVVQVAFVLDLPAGELTWCAEPPECGWLVDVLELGKAPVQWYWRPSAWPVANHVIRRPLRFWFAATSTYSPPPATNTPTPTPTEPPRRLSRSCITRRGLGGHGLPPRHECVVLGCWCSAGGASAGCPGQGHLLVSRAGCRRILGRLSGSARSGRWVSASGSWADDGRLALTG